MRDIRVLLAVDSFKGSAGSSRVEDLIELGVRRVRPGAEVLKYPVADGGEGTLEAIMTAQGFQGRSVRVRGPLGEPVSAKYALGPGQVAVIEMAQSSGLGLMDQSSENARKASTYGVGQVIMDAVEAGARHILVGLGGSATSDGGTGMAKALGVRFLDAQGDEVADGLAGLESLVAVDESRLDARLREVEVTALTDVSNPLTGPAGAVHVYGPQKGMGAEELDKLDSWMDAYGRVLRHAGHDVANLPGAGAAGGLGAALAAFCGASIESGIDQVLDMIGLEDVMDGVDLVITGEGRMDSQSAHGKAPVGVAQRAKRHGLPVVAVVGSRADDLGDLYERGIDLVISAVTQPMSLHQAIARVDTALPLAGESAIRAYLLGAPKRA